MSVTDMDKVDIMGMLPDGEGFCMVISDHLDWEEEGIHLEILQDKINAYLAQLQDRQWVEANAGGAKYVEIMVHFTHDITENCKKFLQVVQDQVGQYGVKVTAVVGFKEFQERFGVKIGLKDVIRALFKRRRD